VYMLFSSTLHVILILIRLQSFISKIFKYLSKLTHYLDQNYLFKCLSVICDDAIVSSDYVPSNIL
jgi:hypothetical protein